MRKIKYLVILFIFLLNINNVSAFDTSKKVYDYAQVLTIKEESKLKNEIDLFIANYNIDLVLITVKHHGKDNTNNYIKEFYNTNGFGIGQNKDAVFCVIDFSSDQEAIEISVFGNTQSILSDNDIKNIKNKLNTKLSKQEYYKTLNLFLNTSNKIIKKNINNVNNTINYNVIKIMKTLLMSVIITLIIGGLLLLKNRDIKYKKVIKDYVDTNSFTINKIEEKLVTTKTITNKQEVKMDKKGFTLIELLAVIIVLSVIILITAISVNKTLDNVDNKLSKTQIKNIENAAKMYYLEEGMDISDSYGCVSVSDLISKGYIENTEITDPKTSEKVLGSVKITYKNNQYSYQYKDDTCVALANENTIEDICEPVTEDTKTAGNIPEGNYENGDEYICEVSMGAKHHFFIVSTENKDGEIITNDSIDKKVSSVNLIMDRNINSDGTPVTKSIKESEKDENGGIYNLVSWINKTHYLEAGGILNDWDNLENLNIFGPITAMNFLTEATNNWSNVPNLNLTYDDENYTGFKITGKARMPIYSSDITKTEVTGANESNTYLYEYLYSDDWVGSGPKPINNIGIDGYWTFSTGENNFSDAFYVHYCGSIDANHVEYDYGVRPVISLKI